MTLLLLTRPSAAAVAPPPAVQEYPTYTLELARTDMPLATSPTYTDISSRLRAVTTERGRSWEFDRIEAGTSEIILDNRDSALNPENTQSVYYPLKHTRQVRLRAFYGTAFPVYKGVTEGFPQSFIAYGFDAVVRLRAVDLFLALSLGKLTPGQTMLASEVAATDLTVTVDSTAPPMPRVPPFDITIDFEDLTVTAVTDFGIGGGGQYTVTRAANGTLPAAHASASTVRTRVVNFAQALSGTRISEVLAHMGIPAGLMDIDDGQITIAASEDLAGTSPLEHIQLVVEAELGRFFVDRAGVLRFIERQAVIFDYLLNASAGSFVDETLYTGAAGQLPYVLTGEIARTEDRFYNRIRLTLPSGVVIDLKDQASIDDHFERTFEKQLPYADLNQANDTAQFLLNRLSSSDLRIPGLEVQGAKDPAVLWPTLLAMEIGQRYDFTYVPLGGGDPITRSVILDRVRHTITPAHHVVSVELTPANTTGYWILGRVGFSELGSTTRLAY